MDGTAPRTIEPERARAALCAEFPDWSIVHSDVGRWWGFLPPDTRRRLLNGALLGEHQVTTDVDADTPEGLRLKLREAVATFPNADTGTAANPARAPQS